MAVYKLKKKDMKKMFIKIKAWYENLPEKKKHIEFISALLTVPMLVTVILLNLNNLNGSKNTATTPTPITTTNPVIEIVVPSNATPTSEKINSPTPLKCKNKIGVVEISSPEDDELISKDPVNIEISYDDKGIYCPILWSYRIDEGKWSDFTDKSISLYNLISGRKKLEVKIKSVGSNEEIILKKSFYYEVNLTTPTPTVVVSPVSTGSATLN